MLFLIKTLIVKSIINLLLDFECYLFLLLHMFEKLVLMLTVFYLKKFIVKVSVKTRETHFSPLLLLDPH